MLELLKTNFYIVDLIIGFSLPVLITALSAGGRIDRFHTRLFWAGCAVGLSWELPIFILSGVSETLPLIRYISPPPVHYTLLMVSHTLWDGGLFLAGVWLTVRLGGGVPFSRFSVRELIILLVYGQVSELCVELLSTFNDGWEYIQGYWWNPTIFLFNGRNITLLPQLIWLAAPVVFYLIALKIRARTIADTAIGEGRD